MNTAVIAFTARGAQLGVKIAQTLGGSIHVTDRLAPETGLPPCGGLAQWTGEQFRQSQALIFVGACGIAVRAIAPYVKDKFTDPAVLSVDEQGRFVVPLLSGHVGGGNALAQQVAAITGGTAAISTATDVNGVWAVDVWAKGQGLRLGSRPLAKQVSARLLEGKPVGFCSDVPVEGALPQGLTDTMEAVNIHVTAKEDGGENTLVLTPKMLVLGIGCRRGTPRESIEAAVSHALAGYNRAAVAGVASIDVKANEPGLLAWCEGQGLTLTTYDAQTLAALPGDFTPSAFVAQTVGVDNVCERGVVAMGATLIRKKQAQNGVTVAVGQLPCTVSFA